MTMPSATLAYNRLTFGAILNDAAAPTSVTLNSWLGQQLMAQAADTRVGRPIAGRRQADVHRCRSNDRRHPDAGAAAAHLAARE